MSRDNPGLCECDIVMDGGLSRALVYTSLAAGLSQRFRFRSIAGASIAAVPAVATAAAQFRKNRTDLGAPSNENSFSSLETLPSWLGMMDASGATNMSRLLQPCSDLKSHFAVLMNLLDVRGKVTLWRALFAIMRHFALGTACGAIGGILALCSLVLSMSGVSIISVIGFLGIVCCTLLAGTLGACVHFAWSGWKGLQLNLMGICSGMKNSVTSPDGLTEWLHSYIQGLAGLPLDRPLTFADLDRSTPSISLTLMTSSMPEFTECHLPEDCRDLAFRLVDMQSLFPREVVNYLLQRGKDLNQNPDFYEGYIRLPPPSELPVVIAARMSLGFPGLLQVVRLYRITKRAGLPSFTSSMPSMFSYAGLIGSCPVSYFDCHLPARPTFGMEFSRPSDVPLANRVRFESKPGVFDGNSEATEPKKNQTSSLSLGKLIVRALVWRTNREKSEHINGKRVEPMFSSRVVLISPPTGSNWVNMSPSGLDTLRGCGTQAAALFIDRYLDPDTGTNAWVRYRLSRTLSERNHIQWSLTEIENSMLTDSAFPSYRQLWDAASRYGSCDDEDIYMMQKLYALLDEYEVEVRQTSSGQDE